MSATTSWPAVPRARMAGWALAALLLHGAIGLAALGSAHPISAGRDGHHYLAIAHDEYAEPVNLAYPPGYPALIRLLSPLVGFEPAAWLVSLVAASAATVLFGLLLVHDGRGGPAAGPLREEDFGVAFFLVGFYAWLHMASTPSAESVGMALMLAAMLALARERPGWAALWLALASCTRITFFLLVPFFCWPALKQRQYGRAGMLAAAGCVGFALQHFLSWRLLGSVAALGELQREHWGSFVAYPLFAYRDSPLANYNDTAVARVSVALVVFGFALWRLRRTPWFLHGAPLLLMLSSLSPAAFFRYGFDRQAIPILGLYVWLHVETQRFPRARWLVLGLCAALSIAVAVSFVGWQANREL